MRKSFLVSWGVIVFFGLLFLNPLQAGAIGIPLISESFTDVTIRDYKDSEFTDTQASLYNWIDKYSPGKAKRWETPGAYAQHAEGSWAKNILFYGIDLKKSWTEAPEDPRRYWLEFDYVSNFDSLVALRVIPNDSSSQNQPWDIVGDQKVFLYEKLDKTENDDWLHASFQGYIPFNSDILQVAFLGVGNQGLRGIDNVELSAVPEPGTIFLLGSGLIGLVGFSRKKDFQKVS